MASNLIGQLASQIEAAHERIKPHVLMTPLLKSHYLSTDADVYFKMESEQVTGSFKIRGACNKLLTLREQDPGTLSRGVTTASTGNHGLACLEASRICGCALDIFVPEGISQSKQDALCKRGANLITHGTDCVEAEIQARHVAQEQCKTYVSPYNDWDVVAGQGTIGLEIYSQLPEVDAVLVSVGGGGLIGGIAAYLKSRNPKIKIIGCQPARSKVMYECVKADRIVHEASSNTISEGTSGDVEDDTITFELCRGFVDAWALVEEPDIESALYHVVANEHKLVEGAAALTVAAYLQMADQLKGQKVVLLMCGANLGASDLKRILDEHIK